MPDSTLIFPRHLRQSKICNDGGRGWFAARGWSWGDFVADGRVAQDFIDTGDTLALQVVAAAHKEIDGGR